VSPLDDIVIRRLNPSDSFTELTELLHRAYAPLAAMGFRFFASHQDVETTISRCKKGETFVATSGGRLVATVTLRLPESTRDCTWYDRDDVASFGQFAVEPELQGSGLGSKLMSMLEDRAKQTGAAELACDTAEGATHLIDYYTRRGYRLVDTAQWEGVNYRSVILSKSLT
jgi:GNAT superfamily N-acetyltransferase